MQDASLVDSAIGVDTTARSQAVWQVKYLDGVGAIDATVEDIDIPGWLETIHPSSGRLSTATGDLSSDDNPCLLPPQAGYKGLENQLYRVQVHEGGPLGSATFKWSRDNAIVASRINDIAVNGLDIRVDSLGRDSTLNFNEGDWVEITDDYREFKGIPGEIRRIRLGDGIDPATRSIILEGDPLVLGLGDGEFHIDDGNPSNPPRNTRIIRWDQGGIVFREDNTEYANLNDVTSSGLINVPPSGTRLFLENGILVDFDLEDVVDEANFNPEFKVGDHWVFSARVNDASIELLDQAPPQGTHHHFAKLAIVNENGINDCRTLWPPEVSGESCACTVCVHPEAHNNGSATIQQAIDLVNAQGGGTVCLSVGTYQVEKPIRITGNSVTLKGQGWQTMLISRNPTTILEIGAEELSSDISVEDLLILTSVTRSFSCAVLINNVLGMTLRNCLITNYAAESGTSQAIKFIGIAALVDISRCYLIAEQGVVGPRLQDEALGTLDFSIQHCAMICNQFGISFNDLTFHINQMELSNNHISNSAKAGIELTGIGLDNTAINIERNLFVNCDNGIRSGLSNVRILHNDLETERSDVRPNQLEGSAIIFIEGLDPDNLDNLQVIGNRIKNYNGHAITVQAGVSKMMVKQNQVNNILGAAFVIEDNGSVDYLSLENNQFTDIDGIIPETKGAFAAIHIQASQRVDITNNVLDRVVQTDIAGNTRAGIMISNSLKIRVAGNRLLSVTSDNYTGLGAGVIISSDIGNFEVNDNEISRVPSDEDFSNEATTRLSGSDDLRRRSASSTRVNSNPNRDISPSMWIPLYVKGDVSLRKEALTNAFRNPATATTTARTHASAAVSTVKLLDNRPIIRVNEVAYALAPNRLIHLGSAQIADSSIKVNNNYFDGTSSNSIAVEVSIPMYCGFTDNEIRSFDSSGQVVLVAGQVSANNNRLLSKEKRDVLIVDTNHYVIMGNMVTSNISIIKDGAISALPEPWKSLNITQ